MPKSAAIQTSFATGEVSPLVYGRVDSPRYKESLATCLNYIPSLQGSLIRRPGTKYVNNVKDSTNPPALIPFKFSATQAYVLEFGDKYIRFYSSNGTTSNLIVSVGNTYSITATSNSTLSFVRALRPDQVPFPGETNFTTVSTIANGSILELLSPYLIADVAQIKFAQNADTLFLTHPSYPPMKLQRYSNYSWTLAPVFFVDGPYMALNSYAKTGDSTAITLTSNAAGLAGTLSTGPNYAITGAANNGSGLVRITVASHNFITGQNVYITGVVGTTEANNTGTYPNGYWRVTVISGTQFDLIGSSFVNAWVSGGTAFPALFLNSTGVDIQAEIGRPLGLQYAGVRYPVYISSVSDAAHVTFKSLALALPSTSAATAWQLGVYSGDPHTSTPISAHAQVNGFPSNVCFHQNRLIFSGCPNFPQQIDGSMINGPAPTSASGVPGIAGTFETFSPSKSTDLTVASNNAFQFTLSSQDVNVFRWMKSNTQGILAGTYESEWVVTPSTQGEAITPTNVNATQSSNYGSANVDAVQVGNAAIYVQRAQRKVREMNYFWQAGTFRSTDLSELSEHITIPNITKLVVQKENQPIVWALRSDGALLTLIYDRSDTNLRAGWARHQLGGQSDASGSLPVVLSMAVIPSVDASFDQLWLVVKRWLNGAAVVTVEQMTKLYNSAMALEDVVQGDCVSTYDVPLTISGISLASPAVVTSTAHGLSNGDQIKITGVVGLNLTTSDINGIKTTTNLVNSKVFIVQGVTANTFQLTTPAGANVDSTTYSAYVSGGQVRKMVLTISGLTYLSNETVNILADGADHPPVTISNAGVLTLQYRAAKVQIGYAFNSDGKLLRGDSGAADGTAIGKTRRVTRVAVMMSNVGELNMGMDFNRLIPVNFRQADSLRADTAPPLFSGIYRDGVESVYDFDGQFCFRQSSMLPGTIQAITIMSEESDV